MVRIIVRYDGKSLVPDTPVDLPRNVPLDVTIHTVAATNGRDPILELEGLGADVWQGIDGVEYQRGEREGWQ